MSALIAIKGKTYDLIYNDRIQLFAPEFLIKEFKEHKGEILEKSGLSESDLDLFLSLVSIRIKSVPKNDFNEFISDAEKITPDPNDTEYFALALKLKCGIWSNDKKLKQQGKIKVYSTDEVIKLL